MLKSKGIVRRIIEDQDKFLVSFRTHDGYFHVEDRTLRDQIRKAHREGREVSFTFDPTLKILSLT
jgi:archaeosine-15-forming tRNA-guanine transglycosylase